MYCSSASTSWLLLAYAATFSLMAEMSYCPMTFLVSLEVILCSSSLSFSYSVIISSSSCTFFLSYYRTERSFWLRSLSISVCMRLVSFSKKLSSSSLSDSRAMFSRSLRNFSCSYLLNLELIYLNL